jgi:hypothetical protein
MSPGVIAIVAFIGMAMIIGAGIVIRRTIRTERARSRKRWEARTGGVGTYDGGGGDCSGGIDSGGFG